MDKKQIFVAISFSALFALGINEARAQGAPNARALTVSACGGQTWQPNVFEPLTMLPNGNLCISGGGGTGGGAVTQATSPWVDNITQWNSVALGSPTNYGTAPTGPVIGANAFITNFPTTQPISGTVNQGTPNSTANAWPTTDTNAAQTIAAPGTAATKAQAVQSAAGTALATAAGQPATVQSGQTYQATQTGNLSFGSVTTSEPAYGSGQDYPTSLTPWGGLRTSSVEVGSAQAAAGITAVVAGSTSVVKSSPGNLYRAYATATSAPSAQQYLVCINATSVPASGAAINPVDFAPFNLATTVGSTASINFGPGPPSAYSTGITCLVSTAITTYTACNGSIVMNVAVR